MLIAVLAVFAVSWLPEIFIHLIRMIDVTVIPGDELLFSSLVTVTITFLNNAINPFLYMAMSR